MPSSSLPQGKGKGKGKGKRGAKPKYLYNTSAEALAMRCVAFQAWDLQPSLPTSRRVLRGGHVTGVSATATQPSTPTTSAKPEWSS